MDTATLTAFGYVFVTVFVFSYVIRENYMSRIMEHLFLGVGCGYFFVAYVNSLNTTAVSPLMRGDVILLIPILVSLTYFAPLWPKYSWLGRYAIAWTSGTSLGVALAAYGEAQIMEQLRSTLLPLNTFDNIVIVASVILGICAMVFTMRNRVLDRASRVGRILLMVCFGAGFGAFVLARVSSWVVSVEPVVRYPGILVTPIAIILVALALVPKEWWKRLTRSS